jgi:hypothetical protein
MQDFNIQMTAATLDAICEFAKRERGYDSAGFSHVQQYNFEDKGEFFFSFRDDFQKDVAYDNQIKNGNMGFFASNPEELWSQILALPSRETRELGVMASRLAFAGDISMLVSEQARSFAKDLIERHQSILTMIEGPTSQIVRDAALVDEVIF